MLTLITFDTQFGSNATTFEDISPTLKSSQQAPSVLMDNSVRRLTAIECERLMGWPDDHTKNRADGKVNAETSRISMCGNGVASPVARWIAEKINEVEAWI